jgi:hypothetical protein
MRPAYSGPQQTEEAMETFTHKDREFEVTSTIQMAQMSKISFEARGFEDVYYMATSFRRGRQRKTINGMFLKEKGGRFVPAF